MGCCEVLFYFWLVRYCYSGLKRTVLFWWPCVQGFCRQFCNYACVGGIWVSFSDAPCPPLFSFGCWCFCSPFSVWWLFSWLVWALPPRRLRKVPSPFRCVLVLDGVGNCSWSLCCISLQKNLHSTVDLCCLGGGVFVYTAISYCSWSLSVTSLAMSLIIFCTLLVLLADPVIWNMRWSSSVPTVLISTLYSVLSFLILSSHLHLKRCGWISRQFESPTSMVRSWGWQGNGWWSLVMTLVWFWSCCGLVLVLFWSCYVSFYFRSVISVDLIWATCFSTCFSVVVSWAVFFMFFVFLLASLGFCLMSWFVLVSSLFALSSSVFFVWGFLFRFVSFPLIHWPVPDLIWVVLLLVVVACFPVCR